MSSFQPGGRFDPAVLSGLQLQLLRLDSPLQPPDSRGVAALLAQLAEQQALSVLDISSSSDTDVSAAPEAYAGLTASSKLQQLALGQGFVTNREGGWAHVFGGGRQLTLLTRLDMQGPNK
jgi:hypothetical protein